LIRHLGEHHLSPEQVGDLAAHAGVKRVVVTHLVPGGADSAGNAAYLARLHTRFPGPAQIADDLDRY
jgi:ribonuclease BN (tRNA processing enzyme)